MATVLHLPIQLEQSNSTSNIILLNHRETLNHTSNNKLNTDEQHEVHISESSIDETNRKVYVYDNKVRLEQVVKQCTGLYQLTHFCIYYYFALT